MNERSLIPNGRERSGMIMVRLAKGASDHKMISVLMTGHEAVAKGVNGIRKASAKLTPFPVVIIGSDKGNRSPRGMSWHSPSLEVYF